MRKLLSSKKGLVALAVLVVAVVSAVGAYAYFSTTGNGQGTFTAGANSGSVTLYATIAGNPVPGSTSDVTFTGDNSNATTSLFVNTISFVSVTSSVPACQTVLTNDPGEFSMANVTSTTTLAAGASAAPVNGTGHLVWSDPTNVDQTPCAGASLLLQVSSN